MDAYNYNHSSISPLKYHFFNDFTFLSSLYFNPISAFPAAFAIIKLKFAKLLRLKNGFFVIYISNNLSFLKYVLLKPNIVTLHTIISSSFNFNPYDLITILLCKINKIITKLATAKDQADQYYVEIAAIMIRTSDSLQK